MRKELGAKAKQPDKLEAKIEELTADLQRVHADFVNFRRRSEEEHSQVLDVAKEEIILQLLPVLDNVERSLTHMPKDLKAHPWALGVKKIGEQLLALLRTMGVQKINAIGQSFNPELHEAVNFEDGTGEHEVVAEEVQTGYKLGDRVIRPTMVRVKRVAEQESKVNK